MDEFKTAQRARDYLGRAVEDQTHRQVLLSLGERFEEARDDLERVWSTLPDNPWWNEVAREECDLVDHLLGAGFVACQAKIAAITSRALIVRSKLQIEEKVPPPFATPSQVRGFSPEKVGAYSKVEVIWALGNYFKRRDEWATWDWSRLTGAEAQTAPVLLAAKAKPGAGDNLWKCSYALGLQECNTPFFADIVDR